MGLQHSPRIVTDGLVLCLDAADKNSYTGSGTTWTDLSGQGNNGTLTNMSATPFDSGNGGSLVFDGVNDYVSFSSFNFGNELTVFCFVRPESVNTISTIFANASGGSSTNGIRLFLNHFVTNSRRLTIEVGNGTGGSALASQNNIITYDTWNQVAFTLSKTTALGTVYHNGLSVGSGTLGVTNYNSNAAFRFGLFTDNQFPYKGRLSNYLLYNRALTATEIQQNYNATKTRFGL